MFRPPQFEFQGETRIFSIILRENRKKEPYVFLHRDLSSFSHWETVHPEAITRLVQIRTEGNPKSPPSTQSKRWNYFKNNIIAQCLLGQHRLLTVACP